MNELMEYRLALLEQNRNKLKHAFRMESGILNALCALLDATAGRETDPAAIKRAKRAMARMAGIFSSLRSYPLLPLCTLAARQAEPDAYLQRIVDLYRSCRDAGFPSSPYVAIGAFSALSLQEDVRPDEMYALYRALRHAHPFLASQEDAISAMLLSPLSQTPEAILARCETIYDLLQPVIGPRFGSWQLSKCLALSDEPPADIAGRALQLYEALRERGIRTGRSRELCALAAPAITERDMLETADRIAEADAALAAQRGFGTWTMSKPIRMMFACSVAVPLSVSDDRSELQSAAVTASVTAALIAATTAAIAAVTAASASASSGGN